MLIFLNGCLYRGSIISAKPNSILSQQRELFKKTETCMWFNMTPGCVTFSQLKYVSYLKSFGREGANAKLGFLIGLPLQFNSVENKCRLWENTAEVTRRNYDESWVLRKWMTIHKSFGRWCNLFFPPTALPCSNGQLCPILFTLQLNQVIVASRFNDPWPFLRAT
jgi:hypothetical protein